MTYFTVTVTCCRGGVAHSLSPQVSFSPLIGIQKSCQTRNLMEGSQFARFARLHLVTYDICVKVSWSGVAGAVTDGASTPLALHYSTVAFKLHKRGKDGVFLVAEARTMSSFLCLYYYRDSRLLLSRTGCTLNNVYISYYRLFTFSVFFFQPLVIQMNETPVKRLCLQRNGMCWFFFHILTIFWQFCNFNLQ